MSDRLGLFAYVSFFLNKVVKVGNGYTRTEELKKTPPCFHHKLCVCHALCN